MDSMRLETMVKLSEDELVYLQDEIACLQAIGDLTEQFVAGQVLQAKFQEALEKIISFRNDPTASVAV